MYLREQRLYVGKNFGDRKGKHTKYGVTYGETNNPNKKITVNVDVGLCYVLDDLKPGYEYTADVKCVYDEGESLPTKCVSFSTKKIGTDDSLYAGWKLVEKDAVRLSSAIGENWEMLGPAFGITQVPLHHIKSDNQTSALRIYKMLVHWLNNKHPTFGKFLKVLRNNPLVYIDQTVINEMKEEFQQKPKSRG